MTILVSHGDTDLEIKDPVFQQRNFQVQHCNNITAGTLMNQKAIFKIFAFPKSYFTAFKGVTTK